MTRIETPSTESVDRYLASMDDDQPVVAEGDAKAGKAMRKQQAALLSKLASM